MTWALATIAGLVLAYAAFSRRLQLVAEMTLTFVLFEDAPRISLRALRQEFAVPLRLLGIGLPLTTAAGTSWGARDPRGQRRGGGRPRRGARLHGRGAGPGGRHR